MNHLRAEDLIYMNRRVLKPGEPFNYDVGKIEGILGTIQGGVGDELYFPTIPEAASAYLYYFAKGHAFEQGNKRTAVMSCFTFLFINDGRIYGDFDEFLVEGIADNRVSRDQTLSYIKEVMGVSVS